MLREMIGNVFENWLFVVRGSGELIDATLEF